MMWLKTLKMAMRTIWSNRMRSILTMLGIIIGVMAVVILVSIGEGTSSQITERIASLGTNLITASITDEDYAIQESDLDTLRNYDAIEAVAPYVSTTTTARNGSNYHSTSVIGITLDYIKIDKVEVQSGRNIVASDIEWRTPVCLIGTDVADEIFDSYDVIGKTLTISNKSFTIVGLLTETGSTSVGSNDDRILIPYSTASRLLGQTKVTKFYVEAASVSQVTRAQNLVEMFLLSLTRDEDTYTVYNQSEIIETMSDVSNTLALLLGGIAAISLLVGGIGIMNIMLVSVSERTREIGIRKAVGAKRIHIMLQFLIEACVLSILGGLIGILLSLLGVGVFNWIADMSVKISAGISFAAIGFCVAIGVVFGSYPAAKASKLVPIEALRYS